MSVNHKKSEIIDDSKYHANHINNNGKGLDKENIHRKSNKGVQFQDIINNDNNCNDYHQKEGKAKDNKYGKGKMMHHNDEKEEATDVFLKNQVDVNNFRRVPSAITEIKKFDYGNKENHSHFIGSPIKPLQRNEKHYQRDNSYNGMRGN